MQQNEVKNDAVGGLMNFGSLFAFLYCLMAAQVTVHIPLMGGLLYLVGKAALLACVLWRPGQEGVIFKPLRRMGTALPVLLLVILVFQLAASPGILNSGSGFWPLTGLVLCTVLRPVVTRYALNRAQKGSDQTKGPLLRVCCVQILFLLPVLALLLFSPLERGVVWALIVGYAICGMLESFPPMREQTRAWTEEDRQDIQALRDVHSCRMFQYLILTVAAAVQITLVMSVVFIFINAGGLIPCMAIALLCVWAASMMTDAVLRNSPARNANPNVLLFLGLIAWVCGLALFLGSMDAPASVKSYLSLALCTVSATVCVRVLVWLKADMRLAAAFALGHTPGDCLNATLRACVRFFSLAAQLIALILLRPIVFFTNLDMPGEWTASFHAFGLWTALAALLLVIAAIVLAFLFPLSHRHLEKLRKYMDLQRQCVENPALRDQLEAVVVKKSRRLYGIKVIVGILWVLCYHTVKGAEKIHLDEDAACVFVCNHGEIYGPIVATLYVPFPFRTWSVYEITDANTIADRTMNGTFQNVKGFPRKILNFLMTKIGAPLVAYIMRALECIPVYHDNPRMLRQTFRDTVTAMEAGDNILVFPENSATSPTQRYVSEGVSEFFTGFTMIGQMYNVKTGKCPLFIPIYANKKKRTITFGAPTRYNPDIPSSEEKERLCTYLRNEMLKIAGFNETDRGKSEADAV